MKNKRVTLIITKCLIILLEFMKKVFMGAFVHIVKTKTRFFMNVGNFFHYELKKKGNSYQMVDYVLTV